MVPGDVLRHRYALPLDEVDALATFDAFHSAVKRVFPDCPQMFAPIVALGNNDLLRRYPPPAAPGVADPWLLTLSKHLPVVQRLSSEEQATFAHSGCYGVSMGTLRVLVLHTNYWATANSATGTDADPAGIFKWLQGELQSAAQRGQVVWLVGHASSGVDRYSGEGAYHALYQKAWENTAGPWLQRGTVAASLFGHEHGILERRQTADVVRPALLSGSLSPDKGTRPVVRQIRFDSTSGELLDAIDFALPIDDSSSSLSSWSVLSTYSSLVGSPPTDVALLIDSLSAHPSPLLPRYASRAAAGTPSLSCARACQRALVCDVGHSQTDKYADCVTALGHADWSGTLALVGGLVAVVVLLMTALVVWKRRSVLKALHASSQRNMWNEDFDEYTDEIDFAVDSAEPARE